MFDFSTQTSLPHDVTAFWTKCCESVGFKLQTHKFFRFQGLHTNMPRLNTLKFIHSFVCLVILSEQFIVFCSVCCFCFNISVFQTETLKTLDNNDDCLLTCQYWIYTYLLKWQFTFHFQDKNFIQLLRIHWKMEKFRLFSLKTKNFKTSFLQKHKSK